MISSSELYYQQIQLEPDWQIPVIARNTRRDYKEQPPLFTEEEIQRRIAEDQEYEERKRGRGNE